MRKQTYALALALAQPTSGHRFSSFRYFCYGFEYAFSYCLYIRSCIIGFYLPPLSAMGEICEKNGKQTAQHSKMLTKQPKRSSLLQQF